jgi:cytochrome c-type biogenesis protein
VVHEGIELTVALGGLAAVAAVLVGGLFVGLTPGAYLAGPAVLGYINVGVEERQGALLRRAVAYVIGAAVPMAALGFLLGSVGDVVLALFAEQVVAWYLLVALVTGTSGLLLSGQVVAPLPSYLPMPRAAASSRDAFLLGVPLGLAACPACTPMLIPIATAAAASGGPLYGAGLLFVFGLGRGIPILAAAASLGALRTLRRVIPLGLSAQRVAGWLLLATAALYVLQALLILSGRPALFA